MGNAIKKTGAQAVHPGYGFLSENAEFATKLKENGITFIGPPNEAIIAMGDKIESKVVAKNAGVNIIPGFNGVVKDLDHALEISNDIGYPVMIKASAGGGGKGMRVAWNDKEAIEGYHLSKQEAASSFGDDRLLIEKFIDCPRHIEIQILADKHGNAVYLNERECSVQRRNQKVVEEAPSVFIDPETRRKMGEQACQLAKAVNYCSAGTVEFLVDSQKNFYFLEMNTRLQVEHPITECITGVDLVHQMIRSAYGHPLKLTQQDIGIRGWAFENRVYAEDPTKNFGMPSIGRLHKYEEPVGQGVRCDSGIEEGSEISMFYDPMICKLTCYGDSRDQAINTSIDALDHYVIRGVTHNIPLLRDVLTEDVFKSGVFTTNYLPETYPDGFQGLKLTSSDVAELASIAAVVHCKEQERARVRLNEKKVKAVRPPKPVDLVISVKGESVAVQVTKGVGSYTVSGPHGSVNVLDNFTLADTVMEAVVGDSTVVTQLIARDASGGLRIRYKGTALNVSVLPASAAA